MQTPAPVEYARATSVDEALALLEQHGSEAQLIAGGHSLIPMMRIRVAQPEYVIDINRIPGLDYIRIEPSAGGGNDLCHRRPDPAPGGPRLAGDRRALRDLARRRAGDRRSDRAQLGHRRRIALPGRSGGGPVRGRRGPEGGPGAALGAAAPAWCRPASSPTARTRRCSTTPRCSSRCGFPIRPGAGSAYEKVERRAGDWAVASAGAYVVLDGDTRHRRRHRAGRGRRRRTAARRRPRSYLLGKDAHRGDDRRGGPAGRRGSSNPARTSAVPSIYKRHLADELTRRACAAPPPAHREGSDHAGDASPSTAWSAPTRSSRDCCSCTTCGTPCGCTGTHWGCDTSQCGTCVVWLDEEPVKTCTVLAAMADGHRVRTVEGLADGGRARPGAEGVHERTRPAVRVLHAGHDDDRAVPARPRPRPGRGHDPARRSPARSAGAPATRTSSARSARPPVIPRSRPGRPPPTPHRRRQHGRRRALPGGAGMTADRCPPPTARRRRRGQPRRQPDRLRPDAPQGGRAIPARPGQLRRRRDDARHAALGDPAQPVRARPDPVDRHLGRRGAARGACGDHRRRRSPTWAWPGCRRCRRTCRRCWPPTRCASSTRRSRSSSPTPSTSPGTRWS